VDSVVNRSITAACPADKLAYQFTGAAGGGAPNFGHCEGSRPSVAGIGSVSYEAIVKSNAAGANQGWIIGTWVGVVDIFSIGTDGAGDAAGYIASGGGMTQKFVAGGGGIPTGYNHYVWVENGTRMKTYLNGVLVNDVASAIGAPADGALSTDRAMMIAHAHNVAGSFQCNVDFFAAYHNTVLSQTQITAHFNASGCPL